MIFDLLSWVNLQGIFFKLTGSAINNWQLLAGVFCPKNSLIVRLEKLLPELANLNLLKSRAGSDQRRRIAIFLSSLQIFRIICLFYLSPLDAMSWFKNENRINHKRNSFSLLYLHSNQPAYKTSLLVKITHEP